MADPTAGGFDALAGDLDYPMFIVTATDGTRRAGCLVGFAGQCGIDPPRFMVWLSRNNHTYRIAQHAAALAVHVPTRAELDLAVLFGSRTGFEVDKFAQCSWRPGPDGVPLLTGCPQWFTGRILHRHDAGDHEGLLLEPASAGQGHSLGQLNYRDVRHLRPGNEA